MIQVTMEESIQSPKQSFIIWFTPRTGSTLLCKSLEQTGVAGKAGEFFNIPENQSLLSYYGKVNYAELKSHLWAMGSSSNGVMGLKYSLYTESYNKLSQEIIDLRNQQIAMNLDWDIWADLFPACRHIFLTRRNKVRLAVSWWKAIVDGQWHLEREEWSTRPHQFYAQKYDLAALTHLLKEHCLRESAMQTFFSHNSLIPMTVVYEDFIENYYATIKSILIFLNEDPSVFIDDMFYKKTADEISEEWVQRFRSDLQKDWDKLIW